MKMQPHKFRDIDEMFDSLSKEELKIVEFLRELVLDTLPKAKEKLSYNVPYYSLRKTVCYIWPGSVAWGKQTYEGVNFGFTSGHLLLDEVNYLDKGTRKQVFTKTFHSVSEIDVPLLRSYLFESAMVDEELYLAKQWKK